MLRVTTMGYNRSAKAALVALYTIIVTGSLVRLTGSGLGCADWPRCSESEFIDISSGHAAIEQLNRLFTGVVAIAVGGCALLSVRLRPRRRDLIGMSLVLVGGVFAQVLIGAVVVLTGLNPYSNLAHFVVSIFLITVASMLVQRSKMIGADHQQVERRTPLIGERRIVVMVRLLMLSTSAVVLSGTVVTGAGPHAGDENAIRIGIAVRTIVRLHSGLVWLTAFLAIVTILVTRGSGVGGAPLRKAMLRFVSAMGLQGLIGYSQYFLGVPPLLVAIHVAISALIWLGALDIYWQLRLSRLPVNVLD